MKQYLRGMFLPLDYEKYLFESYQRCSLGARAVNEYTSDFLDCQSVINCQKVIINMQPVIWVICGLIYAIKLGCIWF